MRVRVRVEIGITHTTYARTCATMSATRWVRLHLRARDLPLGSTIFMRVTAASSSTSRIFAEISAVVTAAAADAAGAVALGLGEG